MDQETVSHYDRDASAIAARYETADMGAIHEYLLRYLPKDGEVNRAYGARHSISPVIRRETPSARLSHFVSGTRFVSRWTTFAGRECFRRGHPDTRRNYQEFIIA